MDNLNRDRGLLAFLKLRFARSSQHTAPEYDLGSTAVFNDSRYRPRSNLHFESKRSSLKENYSYCLEGQLPSIKSSNHFGGSTKVIAPETRQVVAVSSVNSKKQLCCDKCDGPHTTELCPHFKKARESHPDGQKNFYKTLGGDSSLPGKRILAARVIRQPGDGNCLFHSMSYGLGDCDARSLRSEICNFINEHPNLKICETPLRDWIKWDSGSSCAEYSRKMSRGAWGGGIEMAICSQIRKVNIHVYQKSSSSYTRISAFDYPNEARKRRVVRVVYTGSMHYDALSAPAREVKL